MKPQLYFYKQVYPVAQEKIVDVVQLQFCVGSGKREGVLQPRFHFEE